jgi:hypothetical protein
MEIFPRISCSILDELGTCSSLDELGVCSVQVATICAIPDVTNSMQEESDICEQAPAVNLQKTFCSSDMPEELLGFSPELSGSGPSSLEQAKKVNTMAANAAANRKRLVFIMNSFFEGWK